MTELSKPSDVGKPVDVEALVADIRKSLQRVERPADTSPGASIYDDLAVVSSNFSGGQWPSGGTAALFRKPLYRLLGLRDFNRRVVSILSRLVSIVSGGEVPEASGILANQRRTTDMLAQISNRLDRLEAADIGKRLSAIEKQLAERK
jgi:hypothetical protein